MNRRIRRRMTAGLILLGFGLTNIIFSQPANLANRLLRIAGLRYGVDLT